MTDREPIDFLATLFGGKVKKYKPTPLGTKPSYRWTVTDKRLVQPLTSLLPFFKTARKTKETKNALILSSVKYKRGRTPLTEKELALRETLYRRALR